MKHKRGDIRDDGQVFWRYNRSKECWVSPEDYRRRQSIERKRISKFKQANPGYDQEYRKQNAERIQQSQKLWRDANKEYLSQQFKDWQIRNAEHRRGYARSRYWLNPEYYRSRNDEYKRLNRQSIREAARRRYREDSEYRANRLSSHAARKIALGRPLPEPMQQQVKEMYISAKEMSDATGLQYHVDHIMPLRPQHGRFNGLHVPWNLRVIPAYLNLWKKDKTPAA